MYLNKITQQYLTAFPGDFSGNERQRQTPKVLFSLVKPYGFQKGNLIHFNQRLSQEIGLGNIGNQDDNDFLIAKNIPRNLQTYATCYAGHQFGTWAGQLGDGRAIFAGEIKNNSGNSTEIQWKGAGATPYSRHADGRAVLRSSIREYLMSESMYHLQIPTTRALSLSFSGENVARDIMYNGNIDFEKGAVVVRTAESFLRFGHFELLAASNEIATLQKLLDFTIENYFQEIDSSREEKYLEFFEKIAEKTADLLVDWYRVGFTHGVMNTDNMSILGLTIDYGPFGFLDQYSLHFTSNTTDLPGKRYAFGKQAHVAQWNLIQLANALFPIIKDEKGLEEVINQFAKRFWQKHDKMMISKFGFDELKPYDQDFITDWQTLMEENKIDFTLFFHKLETYHHQIPIVHFAEVFYEKLTEDEQTNFNCFLRNYSERYAQNSISKEESLALMQKNNPKFILRNYLLYECIEEVNEGKMDLFQKLWTALQSPYQEVFPEFSAKRPAKYDGTVGCSSLSCSS